MTQYAASSMVLLPRLTKQVMRRSNPELLGMDLRLLMALSYLADHDGAPQQELVDALCMDAKNVVLLLNELEDCGHLIRRRDPEDRRRHRVHITAAAARRSSAPPVRRRTSRTTSCKPSMPTSAPPSGSCSPAPCAAPNAPPRTPTARA